MIFGYKNSATLIRRAAVFAFIFLLASCGQRATEVLFTSGEQKVTKGDVYQNISKKVSMGASKSEVISVVDSLEINGFKAKRSDYARAESLYIDAPDGKKVKVAGIMSADFRNVRSGPMTFNTVGVIFYFDESERLINYHIDYFGS